MDQQPPPQDNNYRNGKNAWGLPVHSMHPYMNYHPGYYKGWPPMQPWQAAPYYEQQQMPPDAANADINENKHNYMEPSNEQFMQQAHFVDNKSHMRFAQVPASYYYPGAPTHYPSVDYRAPLYNEYRMKWLFEVDIDEVPEWVSDPDVWRILYQIVSVCTRNVTIDWRAQCIDLVNQLGCRIEWLGQFIDKLKAYLGDKKIVAKHMVELLFTPPVCMYCEGRMPLVAAVFKTENVGYMECSTCMTKHSKEGRTNENPVTMIWNQLHFVLDERSDNMKKRALKRKQTHEETTNALSKKRREDEQVEASSHSNNLQPSLFSVIPGVRAKDSRQVAVGQPHPHPGSPPLGQSYPGQAYLGHPHPGLFTLGQQHPGRMPLGQPYAGPPPLGQSYPGPPPPDQSYPGPLPLGQPCAGQPHPGQSHPSQPHPDQSHLGSPPPDHSHPGPPPQGQPHPGQQQQLSYFMPPFRNWPYGTPGIHPDMVANTHNNYDYSEHGVNQTMNLMTTASGQLKPQHQRARSRSKSKKSLSSRIAWENVPHVEYIKSILTRSEMDCLEYLAENATKWSIVELVPYYLRLRACGSTSRIPANVWKQIYEDIGGSKSIAEIRNYHHNWKARYKPIHIFAKTFNRNEVISKGKLIKWDSLDRSLAEQELCGLKHIAGNIDSWSVKELSTFYTVCRCNDSLSDSELLAVLNSDLASKSGVQIAEFQRCWKRQFQCTFVQYVQNFPVPHKQST